MLPLSTAVERGSGGEEESRTAFLIIEDPTCREPGRAGIGRGAGQ